MSQELQSNAYCRLECWCCTSENIRWRCRGSHRIEQMKSDAAPDCCAKRVNETENGSNSLEDILEKSCSIAHLLHARWAPGWQGTMRPQTSTRHKPLIRPFIWDGDVANYRARGAGSFLFVDKPRVRGLLSFPPQVGTWAAPANEADMRQRPVVGLGRSSRMRKHP